MIKYTGELTRPSLSRTPGQGIYPIVIIAIVTLKRSVADTAAAETSLPLFIATRSSIVADTYLTQPDSRPRMQTVTVEEQHDVLDIDPDPGETTGETDRKEAKFTTDLIAKSEESLNSV